MTIRERIRYTRALYNITQKNVSDYMNCTKQYITQIENNNLTATDEKLEEILNAVYSVGELKKKGRLKEVLEDLKKKGE
ncbi:UNVERIFIED_ORG: transcriptional regulator [Clostridium botulinum]